VSEPRGQADVKRQSETLLHLPSLVAEVEENGSTIAAYKQAFAQARSAIDSLFRQNVPAAELLAWQSAVSDTLIVHLWEQHIPAESYAELALLAVGGYGRAELHPNSDIDILILTADNYTQADEAISAFVTALWDTGLDIGHSVRDVPRSVQEALADVTVVTNLLQSRLLSGSNALYDRLKQSIEPARVWGEADFFVAKRDEQSQRHVKFHGTAYRLEPNLKESPGGLRDIQTIEWLVIRLYGSNKLEALVTDGYLTDAELTELLEGRDHLWRIRYLLHIKSGRKEDRLLFDYQRDLAEDFGYDQDGNEAVEQFMQKYYRTVTKVERLNGMLLQLFEDQLLNDPASLATVPINKRFQVTNNYLEVTSDTVFKDYPPAILEMFQVFASSEDIKGIGATTLRLLSSHLHLIDRRFRNELIPRDLFLQLFREPQKITRKLRLMNRYGVLANYLPEFEKIVGRMQYDLFHIYTVDEHTLMVIRNLRRFALSWHNEEFPQCSQIMQQHIDRPELLYLIGLYHDIAKGRDGDHSILGAEDAEKFCNHHGLTAVDTKLVTWTIRHHLAMSTTAQRKDISDPEIISEFAHFVGSLRYLNYLYLLTVADIRGTNPELWNSWKANLLQQLYISTERALKRGLDNPIDKQEIIDERMLEARRLMSPNVSSSAIDTGTIDAIWADCDDNYFLQYSADEICWHTTSIAQHSLNETLVELRREAKRGSTEIFIHVADYDQIFVDIATSLEKLSLTVVSADILSSRRGMTLNTFYVLDKDGETIQDQARLDHIHTVLMQALTSRSDLDQPTQMPAPRRLRHFEFNPIIEFDNTASDDYTSLFIKAIDRPGLLSAIGYSFAENNIRVASANITTLGETAEDAFHIQNLDRSKVVDKKTLQQLHDSLLQHVK
jgi:[protein-PII] uridylyltransferase